MDNRAFEDGLVNLEYSARRIETAARALHRTARQLAALLNTTEMTEMQEVVRALGAIYRLQRTILARAEQELLTLIDKLPPWQS